MKWLKSRNNLILVGIMLLMCTLGARLFFLTVVQGSTWEEEAVSTTLRTITSTAPRGQILDRYGRLLAGNEPSFTVQFNVDRMSGDELNRQALTLANILEKNGDEFVDKVPIVKDEYGNFYFTHDKAVEEWLLNQDMPQDFTAEEAFELLKQRYDIEEGIDRYEAQEIMITLYNIQPPISVRNMRFTEAVEKESFLSQYALHYDKLGYEINAEEAFYKIRDWYDIDKTFDRTLSDEDARKVMVMRNQMSQGYLVYRPAQIAKNVSSGTVIDIQEYSSDLSGAEVIAEPVRYYPNESTASHIIGYIGTISDTEKERYVNELGYSINDMIGKDGIEKSMESVLKGNDGVKIVEVNNRGQRTRTISEEAAEKGDDIYLTIDLELQTVAEEALERALKAIQRGGTFESQWGNYNYGTRYKNANMGAAVALDVKTGDVLALANFPGYDPNLFVNGISKADWQALQNENSRDPLSPAPLVNIATRTAVQPGSIFKMVTATAALDSGLDPGRQLQDKGYIDLGGSAGSRFRCLIWTRTGGGTHGMVNLERAIEVSCNYYFYDLAANYDYARGRSLGLTNMDVDKIMSFAEQYGLGIASGIEISERYTGVPSVEKKLNSIQNYLRNMLVGRKKTYFEEEVYNNSQLLNSHIENIVGWAKEEPVISYNTCRERLKEEGVREDMIDPLANLLVFSYFNQAHWTQGDTLNIAIGQGENAYTPLQVARYVATLANGGVRNEVSLIRAVEGEGLVERDPGEAIDLSDMSKLNSIINGMKRVTNAGSSSGVGSIFGNFPIKVAGKTGTAQKSGYIPPPDEVEYIKQYLSRIDSRLRWDDVEAEMYSLMAEDPETYSDSNVAVRSAVLNVSDRKLSGDDLDKWKEEYDSFAWFVGFAPADDPQIAVAVLLVQGGSGIYAAPVAREIIGAYLGGDVTYVDYNLDTSLTQ